VSFSDAVTVLGLPPLFGIYWGSAALLRELWLGQSVSSALRQAEFATALMTAVWAPFTVAALATMVCIYA
jgi:hypothetical protein